MINLIKSPWRYVQQMNYTSHTVMIVLSTALLVLPLFLWRVLYLDNPELAALLLTPLLWVLYSGFRKPIYLVSQARKTFEYKSSSAALVKKAGALRITILSILFAIVCLPLLALQALSSEPLILLTMVALCVTTSSLTLKLPCRLKSQMNEPYATTSGIAFGVGISVMAFVPTLMILESVAPSNGCTGSGIGFFKLLQLLNPFQSSSGDGGISTVIDSWLFIDCFQQKLIGMIAQNIVLVKILYSLSLAMVAVIIAQASAATTIYIQGIIDKNSIE